MLNIIVKIGPCEPEYITVNPGLGGGGIKPVDPDLPCEGVGG